MAGRHVVGFMFSRFVLALVFACAFVACDSGSSSADPDPVAEVSSSSDDDANSSSSVLDKGKSSGGSSKSSSSVKSGDDSQRSSSSSANENAGSLSTESSSSSGFAFKICEDGETWVKEWPDEIRYFHCSKNEWVLDSIVTIERIMGRLQILVMDRFTKQFNIMKCIKVAMRPALILLRLWLRI